MAPATFPEVNVIFAKDQKEYLPLPVYRDPAGHVLSCWRLSWWERIKLLVTGRLWFVQMTFGDPLQPILPLTDKPHIADAVADARAVK
jgi:hypothetical protein